MEKEENRTAKAKRRKVKQSKQNSRVRRELRQQQKN
jgi:hypothetical protein